MIKNYKREKNYKSEIEKNIDELTKIKSNIIDTSEYQIELLDKFNDITLNVYNDKKIICNCSYEEIGTYDVATNIFVWGNSQIIKNDSSIKNLLLIRKSYKTIKSLIIGNKYNDIGYLERMYFYLKNNIFILSKQYIQEFINYCICVSEMYGIIVQQNLNKTYFYLITNYNKL
jgi:hypothetical protein